jgi:hypothetical protein
VQQESASSQSLQEGGDFTGMRLAAGEELVQAAKLQQLKDGGSENIKKHAYCTPSKCKVGGVLCPLSKPQTKPSSKQSIPKPPKSSQGHSNPSPQSSDLLKKLEEEKR